MSDEAADLCTLVGLLVVVFASGAHAIAGGIVFSVAVLNRVVLRYLETKCE